jgi:hypothetical protein
MILDSRDQQHAFLSELDSMRQLGSTTGPVVELIRPMPDRPVSGAGLWSFALALLLFVHGLPLLVVGILPHDGNRSPERLSPSEQTKLEHVMLPMIRGLHISNIKQLRILLGLSGGSMTAAAVGASMWGARRLSRETKEINRAFDSELERITRARPGAGTMQTV